MGDEGEQVTLKNTTRAGGADREKRITENSASGRSNFRVDPLNILGRDQKSGRNKLYALAILHPSHYISGREDAMQDIVDRLSKEMYDHFWELLTVGMDGKHNQILFLPDGETGDDATPFKPGLPESTVSKFCLKVAETIEEITEEAFEMIMPINHKDLAVRKLNFDHERE